MHATSSPKVIDQQPAMVAILAAALLAVGIALGAVMDLDLRIPAAAVSAPDTSYNAVEGIRAQIGVENDSKFGKSGYLSSKTHDELRSERGWWASAPAGTVAGTPVSQAEPNDHHGAGIR